MTGAELAPNVMLRMGHGRNGGKHIGYSLDGGTTWQEPATVPDPKANEGYPLSRRTARRGSGHPRLAATGACHS